jgi:gamma-glutamyltranspeptidase / glutathione hydrolase
MHNCIRLFLVFGWLLLDSSAAFSKPNAIRVVTPATAAVASAHPLATRAGNEILAQGGNAFDAAVAVSAALAVVEPYASGIGGGGFWLLHRARDGFETMIDARETAPGKITQAMFLGLDGQPKPSLSLEGGLAAAIPGLPAGLAHLAKKYGKLPLKKSLAPAIRYAREGFRVDQRYRQMTESRLEMLQTAAPATKQFLDGGAVPDEKFSLRQPYLAVTLEMLGQKGANAFYQGALAQQLVDGANAAGGVWQMADLKNYRVIERKPVKFTFQNATITSAALPSSGGLTLAQCLNILEYTPYADADPKFRSHYIAEAMRRAFHDRARYLGDPDFTRPPVEQLLNKNYAARRALTIDPNEATPSASLDQLEAKNAEGSSTTHFSVIDRAGNRVAATLSINTPFGSGVMAGNTGVLLNNTMDDFALSAGTPNAYGLVGGEANSVKPGKRPLSSMSPTFVEDDRGILILGSPGGSRIISMVLLGILDYLGNPEVDAQRIVSKARFHHQYLPDRIEVEPDEFEPELLAQLAALGHKVDIAKRRWGNMQAVFFDKKTGQTQVGNDPRGIGGLAWY